MAHNDEGASHTHSSTGLAPHTHDGLPAHTHISSGLAPHTHDGLPAHTHISSGLAPHTHDGLAPHTHEPLESPGFFSRRAPPLSMRDFHERAFTVGIGGPVGSGCVQYAFHICLILFFFSCFVFVYSCSCVVVVFVFFVLPLFHSCVAFSCFLSHEIALLVFFLVYSFQGLGFRVLFSPASYSLEQQLHYKNLLPVLTWSPCVLWSSCMQENCTHASTLWSIAGQIQHCCCKCPVLTLYS
jgi:hypothetical protein